MLQQLEPLMDLAARTKADELLVPLGERCAWKMTHCQRVGKLVALTCVEVGIRPTEAARYALGAYVHDIGSVATSQITRLINKRGPLTNFERRVVNQHAPLGEAMARKGLVAGNKADGATVAMATDVVGLHHIPLNSYVYNQLPKPTVAAIALTQLADYLDSMTDPSRPYRRPLSHTEAASAVLTMLPAEGAFARSSADLLTIMTDFMPLVTDPETVL